MAKTFEGIDDALRAWLDQQHMFFVATAPLDGDSLVNCSPKGYDCFRILNEREVGYLDLTGSGIETVSHLQENGRIVFMFCSFAQAPRIVRLHGKGFVHEIGSPEFDKLLPHFDPRPGMRSIVRAELTRISDSCGYGVPRYEFLGDRETLVGYWDTKGAAETFEYQRTHNAMSLDGLPGIRVLESQP